MYRVDTGCAIVTQHVSVRPSVRSISRNRSTFSYRGIAVYRRDEKFPPTAGNCPRILVLVGALSVEYLYTRRIWPLFGRRRRVRRDGQFARPANVEWPALLLLLLLLVVIGYARLSNYRLTIDYMYEYVPTTYTYSYSDRTAANGCSVQLTVERK